MARENCDNQFAPFLVPALFEVGAAACQSRKPRMIFTNLLVYPGLKIIHHTTHPDKAL